LKNLITILTSIIIAGCAAAPLNPEAQKVRIVLSEPGKECKFLGDVTGSQGDFFTGAYTSNEHLETGARNALKNKAAAMGGNVVVILTQRAGQTGSYGEYGGSSSQTNVTLSGNVYNCPE
jgi:hypothetical protein